MSHSADLLDILFSNGLDVRQRRVYLQGDLASEHEPGKNVPEQVIRSLHYLDKTTGVIELWICTSGGDLDAMFGIHDVVRTCSNQVVTVAHGEVCSAGVLVLAAGRCRYATENAWLMSHPLRCSSETLPLNEARSRARAHERQWRRWEQLMGRHTRRTAKWWSQQGELWLSAAQMRQLGIIDDLYTGRSHRRRRA